VRFARTNAHPSYSSANAALNFMRCPRRCRARGLAAVTPSRVMKALEDARVRGQFGDGLRDQKSDILDGGHRLPFIVRWRRSARPA
jgi:hypothetical protein